MKESDELIEEIGAIEAIYPECVEKLASAIYKFKVPQHEHIIFQMSFPQNYPDEKPCVLDVISEKSGFDETYLMTLFQEVIDSIYQKGVVVIFDLFTELDAILYTGEDEEEENFIDDADHWSLDNADTKEVIEDLQQVSLEEHQIQTNQSYTEKENRKNEKTKKSEELPKKNPLEGWIISDPITDRKSTFVAFAKKVESIDEAIESFRQLMEDKKCGRANHAMRAWRIKDKNTSAQFQDCDDDGESAAGGRMLHLMTIMDAWNVMVVCCRWFGGVHIGPDRFKHINSATRDALVKGNFVVVDSNHNKKGKKKK